MLGLAQSTHSIGLMEDIPGTRKWGGCQGSWGWKVPQEERRDCDSCFRRSRIYYRGTLHPGDQSYLDKAFLVTQQGQKSSGGLKCVREVRE